MSEHDYGWEQPVSPTSRADTHLDEHEVARQASTTPAYVSGGLPPELMAGLSCDFSQVAHIPWKSLSYLEEALSAETGFEEADAQELVTRAWEAAFDEGAVRLFEDKLVFPLPVMRKDGVTPIEVSLKRNTRTDGPPWYLSYVDSVVHDALPSGSSPSRAIEDFAYLGRWDDFLVDLASNSLDERWDFNDEPEGERHYPILRSFIAHTFYRLQREDKVCISDDGEFAAFNSGLVDHHYDDIYLCFKPNLAGERNPWRFVGLCTQGTGRLGKTLVNLFNPLPQPASYFERKEDLLFDLDRNLIINYEHVLIDNVGRLPMDFLEEGLRTDDARALLTEVRNADDGHREELLDEVRELLDHDEQAFRYLRGRLDDAVELARKRVRWNWRTAIPMYYPRANAMSLLLPVCLMDVATADAALVVELTDSGNYQGQTILSMRQAYVDARLVCRPDSDWLTPTSPGILGKSGAY